MHRRSPTTREKGHSRTLFGQKTPSASGVVGADLNGAVGKAPPMICFPRDIALDVVLPFLDDYQQLGATSSLRNGACKPIETRVGFQPFARTFPMIERRPR